MGPGGPPPFGQDPNGKLREPKPKSIKELPAYLRRTLGKFFSRMLYIYRIVWDTGPWILFVMVLLALLDGVLPIVSALVGARILNGLSEAYPSVAEAAETVPGTVLTFIILSFGISFVQAVASRVNNIVTSISGELVANNVNMKIMNKAREVDVASLIAPSFTKNSRMRAERQGIARFRYLTQTFPSSVP